METSPLLHLKKDFLILTITVGTLAAAIAPSNAAIIYNGVYLASTATSPSQPFGALRPASATGDAAGITFNSLDLATDGEITHTNLPNNTAWNGGIQGVNGSAIGVQLTLDFGTSYDITGMRIWNFNEGSGGTDAGTSVYDLETSADGINWTLQQNNQALAQASGVAGDPGVYTAVAWSDVRYVRFTIEDTYRTTGPIDDLGGFSEVMFTAVPEPSVSLMLGIGGLALLRLRSRNRGS